MTVKVPTECNGGCYRVTCDHEKITCCYLSKGRCIFNEYSENYLHKQKRR